MIFRSFHGLRFEVLSPTKFIFRLEKGHDPINLEFDGRLWLLSFKDGDEVSYFLSRDKATAWLREEVTNAELSHKIIFPYAHMEKADG